MGLLEELRVILEDLGRILEDRMDAPGIGEVLLERTGEEAYAGTFIRRNSAILEELAPILENLKGILEDREHLLEEAPDILED